MSIRSVIHKLNQIVVFDKHLVFYRSTYFCLQYQIQICLGCLSSYFYIYIYIYIYVTDVYARGVNVNLTPLTSKRGALATGARGCSLWPASCVGIPGSRSARHKIRVGTVWTREGMLHWCRDQNGSEVQGGECNGCVCPWCQCKPHSSPDLKKRRSSNWC